jgi:ABC-type bacteriocin/lantibiotic exporter with double-glycine peptidase domain
LTTLLLVTNFKITLIIIVILLIVYVFILKNLRTKISELGTYGPYYTKKTFKLIDEAFKSIKNIKIKNNSYFYSNLLYPLSKKYSNNMTKLHVVGVLPRICLEVMAYLLLFTLLIFLINEGKDISKIAPIITIYAFSIQKILPAVQNIYQQFINMRYSKPSFDIIFNDLLKATKQTSNDLNTFSDSTIDTNLIKLENIIFKYPNSKKETLKINNLSIKKGSFIGITGRTGSGKTTLVDILLGILTPSDGKITFDNIEVDNEIKKKWLKKVGYASQFTFIADDTLKNNIALGEETERIDQLKIEQACDIANIKDFIENELPEKYETKLGENGARLSGGQIQRVNLARSLYNEPNFLVLDESTNSLDTLTEQRIISSIMKSIKKTTIVMITHKLSSLVNCDNIIFMEDGKISEQGKYNEIYEKNINFRNLVKNRNEGGNNE